MARDRRRDTESKVSGGGGGPCSLRPQLGCDNLKVKFKEDATVEEWALYTRRADRSASLLAGLLYNYCSIDPGLLENSGAGGVCVCVNVCVCVCVRPRGTLIGAISALPHDRCRLFTAETSMPTPAWVVNVRHH